MLHRKIRIFSGSIIFLILVQLSVLFAAEKEKKPPGDWSHWSAPIEIRQKIWFRAHCRYHEEEDINMWQFQMINNTITKIKISIDVDDSDDTFAEWNDVIVSSGQSVTSGIFYSDAEACDGEVSHIPPEHEIIDFNWLD